MSKYRVMILNNRCVQHREDACKGMCYGYTIFKDEIRDPNLEIEYLYASSESEYCNKMLAIIAAILVILKFKNAVIRINTIAIAKRCDCGGGLGFPIDSQNVKMFLYILKILWKNFPMYLTLTKFTELVMEIFLKRQMKRKFTKQSLEQSLGQFLEECLNQSKKKPKKQSLEEFLEECLEQSEKQSKQLKNQPEGPFLEAVAAKVKKKVGKKPSKKI